MYTLQSIFNFLTPIGFLPPSAPKSSWRRILYHAYTAVVLLLIFSFEILLVLDLAINVDNRDEFAENINLSLAQFISCSKAIVLLFRRKDIQILLNFLREGSFQPLNSEEAEIQMKFEERIEWNSIAYMFVLNIFIASIWISSFFTDYRHGRLKFRVWLPYDYTSPLSFFLSFVQQIVTTVLGVNMNIICDCLFSGFLIHIYCQFEILAHRMKNIAVDKRYSARSSAYHHHRIYKFATMVNDSFKVITSMQFLLSTGSVCFNLYRLSMLRYGPQFVDTITYTLCLLLQIYYYCWYGNEVKLKSLDMMDVVMESNLPSLNERSKKVLLMIMRRAMEPVQFTNYHIISMNLESFVLLLKTSYQVYNVLQCTNAA